MEDSDRNCKRHHSKKFWREKTVSGATVKICEVCNRVWGGNPDMGLVRIRT